MSMVTKIHRENKILLYYKKKKSNNDIMSFSVKNRAVTATLLRLDFDAETLLPPKLYSHCWHREPATVILPPSGFYIVVSYGLLSYTLEAAILTCKLRSRKET